MLRNLSMFVKIAILAGVLSCVGGSLFAQMQQGGLPYGGDRNQGGYNGMPPMFPQDGEGQEGEQGNATKADTTKKVKKPLESYFFDDSTRMQQNFMWHVDTYRNRVNMGVIDSLQNHAQYMDYPFLKKDVGDAYLGNLGGASVPLNYFRRPVYQDLNFAEVFHAYFLTPDSAPFYNVKKPLTQLTYFSAGQKKYQEESLGLIHAQSISPSSGFNMTYNTRGTRGNYTWQAGRNKSLSAAFDHTGKKYSVHAGYIFNSADLKENGGILDDADIRDTVIKITQNIPVKLKDARNRVRNNTYYVVQSYGVPLRKLTDEDFSISDRSSLFIGHSFQYSRFTRKYTDSFDKTIIRTDQETTVGEDGKDQVIDIPVSYYENWFVDATNTRDSLFESVMSNRLFVQIQPWDRNSILGVIDAGFGTDNHKYDQFKLDQYLSGNTKVSSTSYYAYGSAEGFFKKYFKWGADIKYHPFGDRSQDISIGANASISAFFKGHPVTLSGRFGIDSRTPSYWSDQYFSNHYSWSNSFAKENETRLEVSLEIPGLGTELRAWQSVVTDKVYFDATCAPQQHGGSISVTGLYARQDVRLGGFHLNHRVLLQGSTAQEIIPVPLVSAYLSYYFEFNVVKNVLRLQMGLDGRYTTKYYAFGYNPATMHFYNQREREIGGYPMVDAFVTAKWKRMRVILKAEHLDYGLWKPRDYFTVLHYPQNKRMIKLGFSWNFYD